MRVVEVSVTESAIFPLFLNKVVFNVISRVGGVGQWWWWCWWRSFESQRRHITKTISSSSSPCRVRMTARLYTKTERLKSVQSAPYLNWPSVCRVIEPAIGLEMGHHAGHVSSRSSIYVS